MTDTRRVLIIDTGLPAAAIIATLRAHVEDVVILADVQDVAITPPLPRAIDALKLPDPAPFVWPHGGKRRAQWKEERRGRGR